MLTTKIEYFPKTPPIRRSCQAALAGWLLAASAGAGYGQITNPTTTLIGLDASNAVRTADARWFGVNSGDYDTDFNIQDTAPELNHAGLQTLRFPGGSEANQLLSGPNVLLTSKESEHLFNGIVALSTGLRRSPRHSMSLIHSAWRMQVECGLATIKNS